MDFSLNASFLGLSAPSWLLTALWQPTGLFGITPSSIQSSFTSLNPLYSVSNLLHPPTDSRHSVPSYRAFFFFLTYKKCLHAFPSPPLLCSTLHILEVTFRPHWSVTSIAQGWDHVTAFLFWLEMCALIWTSPKFRDVWNLGFWLGPLSVPRVGI